MGVAVTKCYIILVNNKNVCLIILVAEKSKIKALAALVPGKGLLSSSHLFLSFALYGKEPGRSLRTINCVCVCMCVYMHVCECVYICMCMSVCVYACV